jgi:hypothetical protein
MGRRVERRYVMNFEPLPFRSNLDQYRRQAQELLEACQSGDSGAIRVFNERHPRFLDAKIPWLPKHLPDSEIRDAALNLSDAELTIARCYDFQGWPALAEYVESVTQDGSAVHQFESAVEAVITGNVPVLQSLLRQHPELVRARSTRVTHFDPPRHQATLLHYVAANGVEGYRQKTPKNAVDVAITLLRAGAEVDALANMYGGECTTMSMLVSSCHPAQAGVQVALVNTLLDFGAAVDDRGAGKWKSPLMTALAFGYRDTAEALVSRGARVDTLAAAAGLGRLADAVRLLPAACGEDRRRAMALAAQHGHVDIVRLLLDSGEDPNRYNPDGNHAHSTPLHQAALAGHDAVVRLLVERGVSLDIKDTTFRSTPLGWAIYGKKTEIAEYLRAHGAKTASDLEE